MTRNAGEIDQISSTSSDACPNAPKTTTRCFIFEQIQRYFESKYLSRLGPWTMAFTVLACGYLTGKRAIVVLEGNPYITNKISLEILSLFPPSVVHEEHADVDALLATDFSATRIVYLPEIDDRKHVLACFHRWTANDGYVYEYTAKKEKGEGKRESGKREEEQSDALLLRAPQGISIRRKKVFGHVAVIATCEKASSIPRWLRDAGWVVPVVLTDDESVATIIVDNEEYTVDDARADVPAEVDAAVPDLIMSIKCGLIALPRLQPHVPFAEDLVDIFATVSTGKVLEHSKVMALLATISILDAGAHYTFRVLGSGALAILVEIEDVAKLRELVSPIAQRQQALTLDEERLIDIMKEHEAGAEKWLPTANITAAAEPEFSCHKKTISRMLDRLARAGYLLKKVEGRGLPNSYKVAGAANLDPITTEMRSVLKTRYGDFLIRLKQESKTFMVIQDPGVFPGTRNTVKRNGGGNT